VKRCPSAIPTRNMKIESSISNGPFDAQVRTRQLIFR
jgi:hypothetical protein